MAAIPILDYRDACAGVAARKAYMRNVGDALRDVGFFGLVNHPLSPALIEQSYSVLAKLFALPLEEKLICDGSRLAGQDGYTAFGKERARDQTYADLKEFWHVRRGSDRLWPASMTEERRVVLNLLEGLETTAGALLELISEYLGQDPGWLQAMVEGGPSLLRLIHYPPMPTGVDGIRAAAHEDINLITLLVAATDSGLEILSQDRWVPVETDPGVLIVDSGDMLANLTGGYLKATTHRVVGGAGSGGARFSMPYFVHPRGDVSLAPLPPWAGPGQPYRSITARDFLAERLHEIGLAADRA